MPDAEGVGDEVAPVVGPADPGDVLFERIDSGDIVGRRGPDARRRVACHACLGFRRREAFVGHGDEHVLIHGGGGEPGAVVEGERVEVHRAGDQPGR